MFDWKVKNIKATNAIFLGDKTEEEGRPFKARFLQAGLVKYDFGVCLLKKETIDRFVNTFIDCPVIINHKDDIKKDDKQGTIKSIWFAPEDGWFWCSGILDDEAAKKVEKDGFNVSCQYRITEYSNNTENKLHNGNPYDKEILNGVFEHLAIVKTPRYEDAYIAVNAIMATNEDKWITIGAGEDKKGRHVLVKDGQTKEEAVKEKLAEWEEKGEKKEETKEKDVYTNLLSDSALLKHLRDSVKAQKAENPDAKIGDTVIDSDRFISNYSQKLSTKEYNEFNFDKAEDLIFEKLKEFEKEAGFKSDKGQTDKPEGEEISDTDFEKGSKTTKKEEDRHEKVRDLEDKAYKEFKTMYDNYIDKDGMEGWGGIPASRFDAATKKFNKKYSEAFKKLKSDRFVSFEEFAKRELKRANREEGKKETIESKMEKYSSKIPKAYRRDNKTKALWLYKNSYITRSEFENEMKASNSFLDSFKDFVYNRLTEEINGYLAKNGWVTLDKTDDEGEPIRVWIEGAVAQSQKERERKNKILSEYKNGTPTKYDYKHTRAKVSDVQKALIKNTIEDVLKEFNSKPIAQVEVRTIGSDALGLCTSSDDCSIVALDSSLFGEKIKDRWNAAIKKGYHPKTDNKDIIKNVLIHELGHVISVNVKNNEFWSEINSIKSEYLGNIKKEDINNPDFISNYARVNEYEFVAEAFAQAKLSKKYGKYTKRVIETMDKHLKSQQLKLAATNDDKEDKNKDIIIWEEDFGGGYPVDEEAYNEFKEKQNKEANK